MNYAKKKHLIPTLALTVAISACSISGMAQTHPDKAAQQRFEQIQEKARRADTTAIRELAEAYQKGIGVEQNIPNAFSIYAVYCSYRSLDLDEYMVQIMQNNLLIKLFYNLAGGDKNMTNEEFKAFEKEYPKEMEKLPFIMNAMDRYINDDQKQRTSAIEDLEKMTDEGSALASMFLFAVYTETKPEEMVSFAEKMTERFPCIHIPIAEMNMKIFQINETNGVKDSEHLSKAIEHYTQAYQYAMFSQKTVKQFVSALEAAKSKDYKREVKFDKRIAKEIKKLAKDNQ